MLPTPNIAVAAVITVWAGSLTVTRPAPVEAQSPAGAAQRVDLAERLASGKLHVINREAAQSPDRAGAVRLSEKQGNGVAWIDGTDFTSGTIEIEVRGKDVLQQSFLGVAFHRQDDTTYEAVYLRPFNFRAEDPARHQHAVQYISVPDYDWPRLRKEFPEEFENPVDQSIDPNGWVPLRIVVQPQRVLIFAGPDKTPALEVRKLGQLDRGLVGLWVGNTSGGDFANLRITPGK